MGWREVLSITSVIILHYKNVSDTISCLDSIFRSSNPNINVLLVDNGSNDDIDSHVVGKFDKISLLRLPTNLGWAGGNNAGIRWAIAAGSNFICLLNNDTLIAPGTFEYLARVAGDHGPCLLQPAIDYLDPSEGAQIDPAQGGAVPVGGSGSLYALDFAYGACLMIPVSVFQMIGLFDERFFLQLEETDFYYRGRRRGIPSLCDVGVRIKHAESRSFGGRVTPDKTYYAVRNSLLLAAKNAMQPGIAIGVLRRAYWGVSARGALGEKPAGWRVLVWLLSGQDHARAAREGIRDFVFRRFGARRR